MSPARQISAILRTLSSPPALAAFMILAEEPMKTRDLAKSMNLRSLDSARTYITKLKGAGLISTWFDDGDLWARTSDVVEVDPSVITIDAGGPGGVPITIGRHFKEESK